MADPDVSLANQLRLPHSQLTARPSRKLINIAMQDKTLQGNGFIGQERARTALEFGLGIDASGYNLYVMGEPATGRFTLVHEYINKFVGNQPTPDDWCYINNFDDEREPVSIRLNAGQSRQFVADMQGFINELLDTFPAAFDNPGYQRRKAAINRQFDQQYQRVINDLEAQAQSQQVALYEEGSNISFSPIVDGKPVDDEEFSRMSENQRQHYYGLIDELEAQLSERLIELPQWLRETSEKLRQLRRDTTEQYVRPMLKQLEHQYSAELGIVKFLHQLRHDLIDTLMELCAEDSKEDKTDEYDRRSVLEQHYLPNVLITHHVSAGAPVIYEANPTYQNLFGRIEYSNHQGALYTNYRMIRAGALHRANGGYLLLDMEKVVQQPYVWEALKLALRRGEIKMELPQPDVGMVNSITLNPQAIPIRVKVVLLGSRELFYSLQDYDDDFDELFRVLVDFDHEIPLDRNTLFDFVARVERHVMELGLKGISSKAMYRLVEHGLRLAEHQHRLSARFADILELVNEARYFCQQHNASLLDIKHIEQALQAKTLRSGRISQSLLDDIKEGQILIETQGKSVGKVNGLTVLEIGDSVFGTPARISATVYTGANGVVDIEREVDLGKSIHSKGVMLLTGYLGYKYAQEFPLTLSANIALEQSYGHIDGDSASLGELMALISALTHLPVDQGIAVTGSINQYGEVQSVGGVNEKIEGFFKLCAHRGLDGTQGVIIPKSNQVNLMLDKAVINAVKLGQFHLYAVENVDQALEIVMGKPAGELSSRQRYARGSINQMAVRRLLSIASLVNGTGGDD